MRRKLAWVSVMVVACATAISAQRTLDGGTLLTRYIQGERSMRVAAAFDSKAFLASVTDAIDKGLTGSPERIRRNVAAFVLEAAAARLDAGDISSARTLVEWACARVRTHEAADDFDVAWHAAALSIIEGLLDPIALESHVQHARKQLPGDPLLTLAWAVAAEQRASPLVAPRLPADVNPATSIDTQARLDAATARLMIDASERFALAAASPRTAADARVRAAHLFLLRNQPQDALASLAAIETATREGWLVYLARLFRGQALDRMQRPDDAISAFRDALKVGPGGQTATMSLSTLLYRRGQRAEAEALVQLLLAETDPISDPWWTYWAGSARLWTSRLASVRGLLP